MAYQEDLDEWEITTQDESSTSVGFATTRSNEDSHHIISSVGHSEPIGFHSSSRHDENINDHIYDIDDEIIKTNDGQTFPENVEREEEEEEESFILEPIFGIEKRKMKDSILQFVIKGENFLFVPDGIDSNIYYFGKEKEAIYPIPEDEHIKPRGVYLSNNGKHIIVCCKKEVYYINTKLSNFKPFLIPFKDYGVNTNITSFLFEPIEKSSDDQSIKSIFGTKNSILYELEIKTDRRNRVKIEVNKLFNFQLTSIKKHLKVGQISGIQITKLKLNKGEDFKKYLVLISTEKFIFQFIGETNLKRMFDYYKNELNNEDFELKFERIPIARGGGGGNDNNDETEKKSTTTTTTYDVINNEFYYSHSELMKYGTFTYLSPFGIFHGVIELKKRKIGGNAITESELISNDDETNEQGEEIVSILPFDYHLLVLYDNKLVLYLQPPDLCTSVKADKSTMSSNSNKNKNIIDMAEVKIVYECLIGSEKGRPRGLIGNEDDEIYMFTNLGVYKIEMENDEKDVWRLYLEKGWQNEKFFNVALTLAITDQERNVVLKEKADYYFEKEKFEKAAKIYAETTQNFEEVAIKFNNRDEKDSLRIYLLNKLKRITEISVPKSGRSRDDSNFSNYTQLCCLCTWLVELYLDKLNILKDSPDSKEKYEQIRKEFVLFLKRKKKYLHKETTFNLISSHGQIKELLFFAKAMNEFDFVISFLIVKKEYEKALKQLVKRCAKKGYQEYWYKYLPILIEYMPVEIVQILKSDSMKFLDHLKLLPTFMRYITLFIKTRMIDDKEHSLLGLLQHIITKFHNRSPTIHNLLLYLYATIPETSSDGSENMLLNFLKNEKVNYNPQYALRVCLENNKVQSSIFLYSKMELYGDAVQQALNIGNIKLAKEFAEKSQNIELTKKLWLKIAKYVIKKRSVREALKLLYFDDNEKNPYLKFENILPHFPDTVLIDDFKNEICKSLDSYSLEIKNLKDEMKDQSDDLKSIREDIKTLKLKYNYISPTSKCDNCNFSILPSEFYLFPCNHLFHLNCLINEVKKYSSPHRKREIDIILSRDPRLEVSKNLTNLDNIIATECPYCGDMMINTIYERFLEVDEDDKPIKNEEFQSWKIKTKKIDKLPDIQDYEEESEGEDFDDDI